MGGGAGLCAGRCWRRWRRATGRPRSGRKCAHGGAKPRGGRLGPSPRRSPGRPQGGAPGRPACHAVPARLAPTNPWLTSGSAYHFIAVPVRFVTHFPAWSSPAVASRRRRRPPPPRGCRWHWSLDRGCTTGRGSPGPSCGAGPSPSRPHLSEGDLGQIWSSNTPRAGGDVSAATLWERRYLEAGHVGNTADRSSRSGNDELTFQKGW